MVLGWIVEPLLAWYDRNARVLPWREEPTPYRVWISEIMLQQTRVEAVKPYFERFVSQLPDITALAEADDDKLMKLWEGLGYYSRARNLKKAAQLAAEEFGGRLPAAYDELLKLPGIGPYTAGAISSIAFGIPAPAVDGNVLRVITRVTADYSNVSDSKVKREMEEKVRDILPPARAGDMNQALMELGATVCLPNGLPKCEICPLKEICEAARQGNPLDFPQKNTKKARKIEEKTVLLLICGKKTAIRKRQEKGLLAGLYEFPNLDGYLSDEQIRRQVEKWGMQMVSIKETGKAKHIFSHVEWHMKGFQADVEQESARFLWTTKEECQDRFPIPSAFQFYTKILEKEQGKAPY